MLVGLFYRYDLPTENDPGKLTYEFIDHIYLDKSEVAAWGYAYIT